MSGEGDSGSHPSEIDAGDDPQGFFRHVMSAIPTSVVAVTGAAHDAPVAMIIGSFVSVSLDPMLVGFFVGRDSDRWALLDGFDRLCVNVLRDDQAWVSRQLAAPGAPNFDGIDWSASPAGAIALDGTVARFDVTPQSLHDAGDHLFVLCRVDHLEPPTGGNPLVYHHGDYTSVRGASSE